MSRSFFSLATTFPDRRNPPSSSAYQRVLRVFFPPCRSQKENGDFPVPHFCLLFPNTFFSLFQDSLDRGVKTNGVFSVPSFFTGAIFSLGENEMRGTNGVFGVLETEVRGTNGVFGISFGACTKAFFGAMAWGGFVTTASTILVSFGDQIMATEDFLSFAHFLTGASGMISRGGTNACTGDASSTFFAFTFNFNPFFFEASSSGVFAVGICA